MHHLKDPRKPAGENAHTHTQEIVTDSINLIKPASKNLGPNRNCFAAKQ